MGEMPAAGQVREERGKNVHKPWKLPVAYVAGRPGKEVPVVWDGARKSGWSEVEGRWAMVEWGRWRAMEGGVGSVWEPRSEGGIRRGVELGSSEAWW